MLNKLKQDLKMAMINKDETKKDGIRVILGEIPRLNKRPEEITNDDVMSILRKLRKSAVEMCLAQGVMSNDFIELLDSYLPVAIPDDVIEKWISENIDFTGVTNVGKMVPVVRNQFGKDVDGKVIILLLNKVKDDKK